ncbi:hypothetical protein AGOR_G00128780 [Albula goreensis]|uniref:CWF19-like protein 2 n=1 Tax=Albula goreensis TaxID=1534307 RepID=A0A8T3DCD8_9TELE|nr:hypothetical protein AGOR_G00128780 [Albula goreensis]
MAAYGGSFESANNIEERKEFKRKAREEVLRQAKEKYEHEERRKELKRARGEDTWMLPEVDLRLQQLDQEHSAKGKKKKEKKSKKSKKEKKKKAKKEKKSVKEDDSSDSSEDSEDEWVEAQSQNQPQPEVSQKAWKIQNEKTPAPTSPTETNKRDDWMTFDFLTMKTTSTAERRAEKEKQKEEEREKALAIEQAGLHKRELNPFWKDGGTGLPPEESAAAPLKKAAVVDDGGLSWLRKSYQRMKEQAEREQRSLEAVVAERYGSMEQFQKRLEEAENVVNRQRRAERDQGAERWRRGGGQGSDRRFGRDRETSPPGREESDRYRDRDRGRGEGRSEGRGPRRDWNADRGRDSRDDRERGRYRDSRADEGERLRPRGESPQRGPRSDEPPSSHGSLKSRFMKPSDRDDEEGSGWASSRREAAPAPSRSSSGFLRPSDDDDAGAERGRVQAWKKPSSREAEPESDRDSVRSAKPERSPHADLKDRSQQPPKRETSAALEESQNNSTMATSPRGSTGKTQEPADSEEEDEEEEEVQILSDEELNKLGAKLVKAELMGNTALVDKLKAQLEAARKAKESRAQRGPAQVAKSKVPGRAEDNQDVVLFRTDQAGRAWPVNAPSEPLEPKGGRRKKKAIETHRDGERVRYFQDDDGMDLQEMVRREKMSTAEDQNALYSRMAAKMMGKQDGDNYTLDDMFVSSAAQRERSGQDEERQRNRAIQEHRRWAGSMAKCPYCFDNPELPKHLIIAIGVKVYLCLPNSVSLAEGHCLIAPLHHHCASTALDEDVWSEIQNFRKALVKMFEDQDQDCVFLETHMNPKRRQHMVYECVPLPRELGDMAPIYFKKAIMESDEEWAMNKKVVDLSSKDIRQAIPKGLPYFSVDFGLQGGFAHVIENEQKFPHYFGKEIIGGMLDLEPRRWRKPMRENFDDQRKKVLQFAKWWKPFDCTKTDS